jgi:hypothetical protein
MNKPYASLTVMNPKWDSGPVNGVGRMRRRGFLKALGASGAAGLLAGCPGGGAGPTPTPTPSPTPTGTPTNLPNGIPNATMMQNLPLASQLAGAYRLGAYLVRCEGSQVDASGILIPVAAWTYIFSYPGSDGFLDGWKVFDHGQIAYSNFFNVLRYDTLADITQNIHLDSPAAVQAAISYGFNRCFSKFPDETWAFRMNYSQQGGVPIAHLRLEGRESLIFGEVDISSQTGALLGADVSEKCQV